MLDRYALIRLPTWGDADEYCKGLPPEARAKVCPTTYLGKTMFYVTVLRTYTGGRI